MFVGSWPQSFPKICFKTCDVAPRQNVSNLKQISHSFPLAWHWTKHLTFATTRSLRQHNLWFLGDAWNTDECKALDTQSLRWAPVKPQFDPKELGNRDKWLKQLLGISTKWPTSGVNSILNEWLFDYCRYILANTLSSLIWTSSTICHLYHSCHDS